MTDDPRRLPPNVTPFGAAQRKRARQSDELRRLMHYAGDIEPSNDVPYLIKGWLAPRSLAVLYGPANVGKTFLALDLAHALAKGGP